MSVYVFSPSGVVQQQVPPDAIPADGFVWWRMQRSQLSADWSEFAQQLQRTGVSVPLDLHQQDLKNEQHPCRYDYTSEYELLVFRRLSMEVQATPKSLSVANAVRRVATDAVGFLMYDRLLVTVHEADCPTAAEAERRALMDGARRPSSAADQMLRLANTMVDSYLEFRKVLTSQVDDLQAQLLDPNHKFDNWRALLDVRNDLAALEDVCEEQHDAMQEWLDALLEQPVAASPAALAERDLLAARSRDVIEHIARVKHHVRRLEGSAESAVQIHFSAQSMRTNDIMRTLTAVTAIFLPLNLITGFFGMNFDALPLIHHHAGVAVAVATMVLVAVLLAGLFARKRYIAPTSR
jgi:magnesium transporter